MEEEQKIISKYNEGWNQIARLSQLWYNCNYYSKKGELDKWRYELECIYRELYTDAIRLDGNNADDLKKPLRKNTKNKVKDKEETISWIRGYEEQIKILNYTKKISIKLKRRSLYYNSLIEVEKYLRQLQEASGKGSKFFESDDDSLEY